MLLLSTTSFDNSILLAIKEILLYCSCPDSLIQTLEHQGVINEMKTKIEEDLLCFCDKDPASKKSPLYILNSYLSFKAVMSYRVAHKLYELSQSTNEINLLQIVARLISEKAKVQTGIEIHPAAKIGRRFVVDHGYGTVVGETCEIGQDCYILQGVVLGARGIAGNKTSKRHPTLGDRVEVGGCTRIFGAVRIGDDVTISPYVVITEDIPANSKVLLVTTNQIIKNY